jgi:hypothetical protein
MRVAMVVQERGAISQVLRILECSISEKAIHQVAVVQILPPPSGLPTAPAAVLELIPLPTPSFGFLIVQEGSIGFYDPSVHQEHDVDDELIVTVATLNTVHPCGQSGLITAHTFDYNEAGEPRLVLISEDGYLWWSSDLPAYLACPIRELQLACSHVPGLVSPMCIESLGNGTLIVPAQMGDGLILKVDFAEAKLDPKVSLPGLSSVVDFVTADLFGEQQSQLFACSASTPSSGFVRCVRNGIGVTELMKSDPTFQGVNGLFTLRANPTDLHHAYLVISFVANTRVMSVSDELRDISHLSGFSTDSSTIYCGESVAGFLVQFCEHLIKAVRPVANESSVPQSALWRPPTGASICAGSTKSHVVVAASSAAEIFVLTVSSTSEQLAPSFVLMCSHKLSYAICCIEVVLEPAAPADVMDGARLQNSVAVIAGTYEPALDVLVAAPGAMHVVQHLGLAEHSHTDSSKPHAVKFAELDGVPCVLVGLRNGYLLCFEYRICPSLASVMRLQPNPTVRRIGRHPTQLAALDSKGIMALSDHLCLVQHERHRLTFAPICLASAGHCTAFACDSCPRGILASMNDSLSILSIDQERPLNLQSIPVADGSPRRLLYHAASQALLVACYSATSSDLRVLHTKLRTMHTVFQAEPNEYIYSLSDWAAADESWVLVGTMRKQVETDEPLRTYETSGRLLVFKLPLCMDSSVASAACVQLLGDVSLNGAVLCIQPFTDRLVMASASDRLLMISVRRRRTIDRITLKIVAQTSVRHRIVSLSIANRAQASPAVPSTVLIAVGDDGDSVWYLTYSHTPTRHFTKVYPRLVLCNAQLWLAAAQPGASERASVTRVWHRSAATCSHGRSPTACSSTRRRSRVSTGASRRCSLRL